MPVPTDEERPAAALSEPEKASAEQDPYGKVKINIPVLPGILTWVRELEGRKLVDPLWTRRSAGGRVATVGVLGAIVGLFGFGGWHLLEPRLDSPAELPALYALRVVPVSEEGLPVEDARVRASVGNEAQQVPGGWEVEIPRAKVPATRQVTVWAEQPSTAAKGRVTVELGEDPMPSIQVPLVAPATKVRGMIVDGEGRAVSGAQVSVLGYGEELRLTADSGAFELVAHRPPGERVRVHVEHPGYAPVDEYCLAAGSDCYIVLKSMSR